MLEKVRSMRSEFTIPGKDKRSEQSSLVVDLGLKNKVYVFQQMEGVTESFIYSVLPMLPEERRRKVMHYRQFADRRNCVISYLMLKIGLQECFQIVDFTLGYGENEKPYLAEYPDVYFNISHCSCGCAVAVADSPIGVDIQDIRPFSWEIARRVCSKQELEVLGRSSDRDWEFTRIWAMKESYVKMTGQGIRCNLSGINTLSRKSIQVSDVSNGVIAVCF